MYNYSDNCGCNMNCQYYNGIYGNSFDIDPDAACASEIRADVVVDEYRAIRIWGQIKNKNGLPIPNALLKLVRISKCGDCLEGVAHTMSDCNGFYQFDLCVDDGCCYRILVNKSLTGPERVVDVCGGNCGNSQSCNKPNYPVICPKDKCDCSCKCNCECKSECCKPKAVCEPCVKEKYIDYSDSDCDSCKPCCPSTNYTKNYCCY